jgi:hypothetical protein
MTEAKAHLAATKQAADPKSRRALLEAVQTSAATKVIAGAPAERSQDFLYANEGLPG